MLGADGLRWRREDDVGPGERVHCVGMVPLERLMDTSSLVLRACQTSLVTNKK